MSTDSKVQKKILVVDDNDVLRGALKLSLEQDGYNVTVAENGRVAQEIVGLESYALVISDIRMAPVDGITLLRHIKNTKPVPVILMTGFSDLVEANSAVSLGADGFLAKPFKSEDLTAILEKILGVPSAKSKSDGGAIVEPPAESDHDYCKLGIDDFITGHEMRYDIFIRLAEGKYVKVAHQGEDIPRDQIQKYKRKGLSHLYMRRGDFKAYLGFSMSLASLAKQDPSISREKRLNLAKHTGEILMEHVYSQEISNEDFESARTVIESTVDIVTESDGMADLLAALNTHADFLYAHSLGVSLYSVLIAKEMKWNSPANIYKIAMAGLFHDIGKKEIDRAILEKARSSLSAEEVKIFESHAERGHKILASLPSVPSDILQVALHHHESCSGAGYPGHLRKSRIHPFARLVAVANQFSSLVISSPAQKPIPAGEAIQRMKSVHGEDLDAAFLSALAAVVLRGTAQKKAA